MPKCIMDGKEVEFSPGENMIEVAKKAGIEIPFFCYHPGLSVVAQCRMCVVEIEKSPKLQTACSTPVADGMVIHTKSDKVKKQQKAVMEFLLVNHPLDCPICDKSGECDLQDNSYKYGDSYMRTTEERRTYLDLDMGPVIKKNMNRCIHCTRCIRFGEEVAKIHEMVAVQRGNNTEITTIDGRPLETDYAGNYSDICPTGSLTLKDFRFKKRAWFLKKTATVCEGCSRGCAIELQHEGGNLYRCIARPNPEVNQHWICDEGRFNYQYVESADRIVYPTALDKSGTGRMVQWSEAVTSLQNQIMGKGASDITVLVGTDLTNEEMDYILQFSKQDLNGAPVYHFGTPGISNVADDGAADAILKRKSRTSNLHGAEKKGIKPFDGKSMGKTTLVFRGGRAVLPELNSPWIGVGVFFSEETNGAQWIIPGPSFTEKSGTIVNFSGLEQKLERAIPPKGKAKPLSEILMLLRNTKSQAKAMTREASL